MSLVDEEAFEEASWKMHFLNKDRLWDLYIPDIKRFVQAYEAAKLEKQPHPLAEFAGCCPDMPDLKEQSLPNFIRKDLVDVGIIAPEPALPELPELIRIYENRRIDPDMIFLIKNINQLIICMEAVYKKLGKV